MPVKAGQKSPIKETNRKKNMLPGKIQDLVSSAPRQPGPKQVRPMLATLTDKPFNDPDWMFEIKWDGYRATSILKGNKVSLLSRNKKSFNEKFYPVYESLIRWNLHAVLDGEIVVINEN